MFEAIDFVAEKLYKVLDNLYGENSRKTHSDEETKRLKLLLEYLELQQSNNVNSTLIVELVEAVYTANAQAFQAGKFSAPRYSEAVDALIIETQSFDTDGLGNSEPYHPDVTPDVIF